MRESAKALAASEASLHREREQVVTPLQHLIDRNNVTALVRELMRRKGAGGEHGPASG